MNRLKQENLKIYEYFQNIDDKNLSSPLLVSSEFIFNEDDPKIMYIGKETNTWCNQEEEKTLEELETCYLDFLNSLSCKKYPFWRFIQNIEGSLENVLWTNALLCGKRKEKGTPEVSEEIKELSVSYLTFLYYYFLPDKIVIVSGNCNPYYEVITKFLDQIGARIDGYPTKDQPVITNEDETIFWTFHPQYLQMSGQIKNVEKYVKQKVHKENGFGS